MPVAIGHKEWIIARFRAGWFKKVSTLLEFLSYSTAPKGFNFAAVKYFRFLLKMIPIRVSVATAGTEVQRYDYAMHRIFV